MIISKKHTSKTSILIDFNSTVTTSEESEAETEVKPKTEKDSSKDTEDRDSDIPIADPPSGFRSVQN